MIRAAGDQGGMLVTGSPCGQGRRVPDGGFGGVSCRGGPPAAPDPRRDRVPRANGYRVDVCSLCSLGTPRRHAGQCLSTDRGFAFRSYDDRLVIVLSMVKDRSLHWRIHVMADPSTDPMAACDNLERRV